MFGYREGYRRVFQQDFFPKTVGQTYEDFVAGSLPTIYGTTFTGSGSLSFINFDGSIGVVQLRTGATTSSSARLHMSGVKPYIIPVNMNTRFKWLEFEFRCRPFHTDANSATRIGLVASDFDPISDPAAANYNITLEKTQASTLYRLRTSDGVLTNVVSTGVNRTGEGDLWRTWKFVIGYKDNTAGLEYVSVFYDDVLKVTKTTNLPPLGESFQPYFGISNRITTTDVNLVIDYFNVRQWRSVA